jgi:hypothetical protein
MDITKTLRSGFGRLLGLNMGSPIDPSLVFAVRLQIVVQYPPVAGTGTRTGVGLGFCRGLRRRCDYQPSILVRNMVRVNDR